MNRITQILLPGTVIRGLIVFFLVSWAQVSTAQFVSVDPFGNRCFVENRGQFDKDLDNGWDVRYVYHRGQERIYFCAEGLAIEHTGAPFEEHLLKEAERGRPWAVDSIQAAWVYIAFEGANKNVVTAGDDVQPHYFTYGGVEYNSRTFKKIVYRNLYPGIDLEYTIPENRNHGVKYCFVLRPGADPDHIRMHYSGAIGELSLLDGNLQAATRWHTVTDHKPLTWSDSEHHIRSSFKLRRNVVSFSIDAPTPVTERTVIDPWLTPVTSLTTTQWGFDVDYDNFGNVYVYGGSAPCQLSKYNSTGTLIWTFSGTMVTPAWNTSGLGSYASNFVVIPSTGESYLGQALVTSGPTIIRLDPNGNYDNFMTIAEPTWREIWDLANHCSTGKIYGLGGSTASKQSGGIVNPGSGSITPISFFNLAGSCCNDIVSYAIDSKGEMFWLFACASSTAMNNHLARIDAPFTSSVWISPSTFTTMSEAANHNGYTGAAGSNAYNAIAVNDTFLYYYDGLNVAAYSKTTGAIKASFQIPGHQPKKQGGIAVDQCNNIYVGGKDSILCYKYDGNVTFTKLTAVPLGIGSSTTQFAGNIVCDIRLAGSSQLVVSGLGFVGTFVAPHSGACFTSTNACYGSANPQYGICAGNTVAITVGNPWGLANPTYSVMPGGTSNTTGSFVVSPTVTTGYTISVIGKDPFGATLTSTSVATVNVYEQPSVAPSVTQATCADSLNGVDLNLTFFPPVTPQYSVTWTPMPSGVTDATQTIVQNIAAGAYTAVVSTGYCSAVGYFTINPIPLPVNFAILPADKAVLTCTAPAFTFSMVPATNNYTTTNHINFPLPGANPVFSLSNAAGVYTVYAEGEGNTCPSSKTLAIVINTATPSSTVGPLYQAITCAASSATPVIATADPTVNITHLWQAPQGGTLTMATPSATFVPGAPGKYTHCIYNTTNGCKSCTNFTVFSNSGFPVFNMVSPQNFSIGCGPTATAQLNFKDAQTNPAGGSVSYTLLAPGAGPVPPTGTLSTQASYQTTVPGTFTAITRDAVSGCDTKVYFSVLQNTTAPTIDTMIYERDILTCAHPTVLLHGISATNPVAYEWRYENISVAGQQITVGVTTEPTTTLLANYTLQVTDQNNKCVNYTVIPVYQNIFEPLALVSGLDALTCITTTIQLSNNSETQVPPQFNPAGPVVGFLWEGPSPQVPLSLSTSYIAAIPGTYTMTAMDTNNGCKSKVTKTVADGKVYPLVNVPDPPPPFMISCATGNATMHPTVGPSGRTFRYEWTTVPDAGVQGMGTGTLVTNKPGRYMVHVTDELSGCEQFGFVDAITGTISAALSAAPVKGYAPLEVRFENVTETPGDTMSVNSLWSFGVDSMLEVTGAVSPKVTYGYPGTYTVLLYASLGNCNDSAMVRIEVETPSWLEVPNVFTPNGDGANDEFFLHSANLRQVSLLVRDRWGNEVFAQDSERGMVLWNGLNLAGKAVPDGVYLYFIKATGSDGKTYDLHGQITLTR